MMATLTMTMAIRRRPSLLSLILSIATLCVNGLSVQAQLNERDRQIEYRKRNYTWPILETVPNTDGWRKLMQRRLQQVSTIRDTDARYEGYLQLMNSAVVAPNFTETGWGLSKASDGLLRALQKGVRDGLSTARSEGTIDVIEGDAPLFVDRPDLNSRVLKEIKPLEEAWSGVELVPHRAYGFRLYKNNSRLFMHTDKTRTHVISAILHIDRSDDADPWPIVIEDYHGITNEVLLEPGDILFYESSKCFHGRPRKFQGSWYTSVFVHFYPVGWQEAKDHDMEMHYAVPPVWNAKPPDTVTQTLEMVGTSMKEPDCPDIWCDLGNNTVKWQGPGEEGFVLTTTQRKYALQPHNDEL